MNETWIERNHDDILYDYYHPVEEENEPDPVDE